MELTCEKYKLKMAEAVAVCTHLEEYCQFRAACIINFLTRERLREARRDPEPPVTPDGSGSQNSSGRT